MALRTRMKITAITKYDSGAETVEMKAIEDSTIPDSDKLELGVPSGTMTVRIDNPANIGAVLPGEEYYITFTNAP